MNTILRTGLRLPAILSLLLPAALARTASAAPLSSAQIAFGKKLFQRYCASCHGVSGKGDGFVADALSERPPDLTAIAARRGVFPEAELADLIDGRRMVRAHGERVMPVWGTELAEELLQTTPGAKETSVKTRIALMLAFIESIQVPAASMQGMRERAMENCPSTVAGASTRISNVKDAVELRITVPFETSAARIRALARLQATPRKKAERKHTGNGEGGGELGYCPIVHDRTVITVEDIDGGALVIIKPKNPHDLDRVRADVGRRLQALARVQPSGNQM